MGIPEYQSVLGLAHRQQQERKIAGQILAAALNEKSGAKRMDSVRRGVLM
jgi:hypothetical protein